VQRDLAYVMGNNGSLSSFDGTLSDFMIYPRMGFSVLRNANIPAILIEGSFFSSTYEEQRLKIFEFNQIEAWGIFRGLGKYLKAGIPKLDLPTNTFENKSDMVIKYDDKSGIKSVIAKIDSLELKSSIDTLTKTIIVKSDLEISKGEHTLDIVVENKNGNHSFPFRRKVVVK
jgi:hypothetical protein